MSKKMKFMLLLCSCLTLGFIATNMVGYFVARDSLSRQIATQTLPLIGDSIYSDIQRDILKPVIISSFMANDTFLKSWVLNGEQDSAIIQQYLLSIQQKHQAVTSFFISDRSLNYYHSSGILKTVSAQDPADQWYFDTKQTSGTHEINIDMDASQHNQLTVFINYKLFDQANNFLGIVGVGLSLTDLHNIIEAYKDRYQGEIFFIDSQGNVQLHSADFNGDPRLSIQFEGRSILEHILDKKTQALRYPQGPNNVLLDTRFIEEFNWYLVVKKIEPILNSSILNSLLLNLFISLAITFIVLSFSWYTLSGYQRKLEKMANTDKLTGLNNRQMFDPTLEKYFKRSLQNNSELAVVILDIDHFKQINDQHGHPFGDKVLVKVAELLADKTRKADVLCRWGGEEFILLMPHSNIEDAHHFCSNLKAIFQQHIFQIDHQDIQVSFSVGISQKTLADSAEKMVFRADQALLTAKSRGRDQIVTSLSLSA